MPVAAGRGSVSKTALAEFDSQDGCLMLIGLDPSSRKLAVAIVRGDMVEFRKVVAPQKMARHQVMELFFWETKWMLEQFSTPIHFFYEAPLLGRGGVSSTIKQVQAASSCVVSALLCGVTAYEVNVQTWKKAVVGRGNASKEDVRAWLEEHRPEWASQAQGDQDLIDAACVAQYGLGVLSRGAAIASGVSLEDHAP